MWEYVVKRSHFGGDTLIHDFVAKVLFHRPAKTRNKSNASTLSPVFIHLSTKQVIKIEQGSPELSERVQVKARLQNKGVADRCRLLVCDGTHTRAHCAAKEVDASATVGAVCRPEALPESLPRRVSGKSPSPLKCWSGRQDRYSRPRSKIAGKSLESKWKEHDEGILQWAYVLSKCHSDCVFFEMRNRYFQRGENGCLVWTKINQW